MTTAADINGASRGAQASASARPEHRVDFDRQLVCVLGLPFDAIGLQQAVERVRSAAFEGRRCFMSTPNLNFAMTARTDPAFRDTVLRSDLSLADGMPLVWIARLLGLPLSERVSGADLFESLQAHAGPPITVFLFGGPPGAAELASAAINRRQGGVRCVGFDTAGFGSIESMSSDEIIERINHSGAQFVVASLGAGKGQAWLERNAERLTAPVLAHLGAVVNFAAGTVRRAPPWMIAAGLEWLWRIKEEPALWRRYWRDGVSAIGLLLRHVVPDAIAARRPAGAASAPAQLDCADDTPGGNVLRLTGDWRAASMLGPLRAALARCAASGGPLTVDLAGATALGNAAAALLLVAKGWFGRRGVFQVIGVSPTLAASLRRGLVLPALTGSGR